MLAVANSAEDTPACAERQGLDDRRLEAAFRAHHASVLAYAERRTADRQAAEDVAAEVFAVASRRRSEMPRRREKGWLIGVARKVLANQYRAEQRRTNLRKRMAEQERPDAGDDAGPDIAGALAAVAGEDREIHLLRYWDDLPCSEIAAALGCSLPATCVRLHRARGRLAEQLGGESAIGQSGRGQ